MLSPPFSEGPVAKLSLKIEAASATHSIIHQKRRVPSATHVAPNPPTSIASPFKSIQISFGFGFISKLSGRLKKNFLLSKLTE